MLDEAFRLLDDHLGNLHVTRCRFVKSRRNDFAFDRALHVRDFFRPLVDQQHDQRDLGMVVGDRIRDRLQNHRLAGTRRRDDESSLPLANRRDQIENARSHVGRHFELDALVGIERREVVEKDLLPRDVGMLEVDRLDFDQREVTLPFLRRADLTGNCIAGAEIESPNL